MVGSGRVGLASGAMYFAGGPIGLGLVGLVGFSWVGGLVGLGWVGRVGLSWLVSSFWRLRRAQARREPKHFLDFSLGVCTPHGSH